MTLPVIGVTTSLRPKSEDERERLYKDYTDALRQAGANPVYIHPRHTSEAELLKVLKGIDGLLLTGGRDIHTSYARYIGIEDESNDIELLSEVYNLNCEQERDAYELPLARLAYDLRIPILGICRGFQLLNVILGGSLIIDIRIPLRHKAYTSEDEPSHSAGESAVHSISIEKENKLHGLIGTVNTVNSRHHQGFTIAEKAECLRVTALAPDGIIEAVESDEHPCALAVQWHPERGVDTYIYKPCRGLFQGFVDAASGKV